MEQSELRRFEYQCIQEEPPFCQAACPLHVDVKAVNKALAAGDAAGARKALARNMPLPGILGLICDHPCEARCRRADVETAIRIGELERAAIRGSSGPTRVMPLPGRGVRVAVLGGGMSALTVAWDLGRKGYLVTILAEALGGTLLSLPEERLPRANIAEEAQALKKLKMTFAPPPDMRPGLIEELMKDYAAVYVGLDDEPAIDPAVLGLGGSDPLTLAVSVPGVFAGGTGAPGAFSPVTLAAQGRKAAVSIDRHVQKVSMSASREKEGPFETRLSTPIEDVVPRAVTAMSDPAGYTADEAAAEAGRCLQCECLRCVKVCPYLERFQGYPRRYAREIYNNLAVVHGQRKANGLINSCSWCGLCATVCPNDFFMGELTGLARREMVVKDHMPPSAHDFALTDLAFSASARAALARHAPGKTTSAQVFFPGCQLSGSSPEHVRQTYEFLRDKLPGGVGLMLDCCGAPAVWAGREDLAAAQAAKLRAAWEGLGRPRLVLACSTCLTTLERLLPEAQTVSLWQVLEETGLPPGARPSTATHMLHDPCTTHARPEVQASVRRLIASLGLPVTEPALSGALTECCGFGGLMDASSPDMAREQATRRAARTADTHILAYCAMCRDELSRSDKTVAHLLDYLFPGSPDAATPAGDHPLVRKGRGTADRRENRARLKAALLRELWQEETAVEAFETIRLELDAEVQEAVDARRILADDLRRTIHAAQTSGNKLAKPGSDRLIASHRPAAVTYWVEYSPAGADTYRVHRAWSHRMTLA
jgi:Fe-S oxidoreductase